MNKGSKTHQFEEELLKNVDSPGSSIENYINSLELLYDNRAKSINEFILEIK